MKHREPRFRPLHWRPHSEATAACCHCRLPKEGAARIPSGSLIRQRHGRGGGNNNACIAAARIHAYVKSYISDRRRSTRDAIGVDCDL